MPLAGFPPSVRLKERQTKRTSLILTERLQYKKSLGRIFGAATPPGALVCKSAKRAPIFGKSAAPPLGGYGVTKSLKVLRDKLGHHNFLFDHAIRL